MPTLTLTLDGANGLAHDWNHVLTPMNQITTWANTTKIDYVNVQDNGLRTSSLRTHAGSDHLREKVRNASGSTLAASTLVYHSGSYDDGTDKYPSVAKAQSQATDAGTKYAIGIVISSLANNADGIISRIYELASLNTSAQTLHDPVYLHTTAGEYTYTKPTAGNTVQIVGRVSKVHASDGRIIFTFPGTVVPREVLSSLVLKYDAQEYVTHTVSSAGVYSIATTDADNDSGAITLDTVDSITLDSDTATEGIVYADGGTGLLRMSNSSSNVIIKPLVDAKDIIFQQYDGTEVVRVTDAKGLGTASGTALKLSSNGVAWEFPTADGSADQYLKTDGSGNLDWVSLVSSGISWDGSTANGVATFKDADEATVESNLTYDDTNGLKVTSATASKPILTIENTNNGATSGYLKFVNDRGAAGAADDVAGTITFYGDDANQDNIEFARMEGMVQTHTEGQEGGKIKLSVASHDGEMVTGLLLADGDAEDEIDVTIGSGDDSLTSVAGVLSLTKQPCFSAELSGSAGSATGDGTVYTVAFDSERFDQGGDFTNSSGGTPAQGTFTAPVSGRYMLTTAMTVRLFSADNSEYYMKFVTSNKTYSFRGGSGGWVVAGDQIVSGTIIADMDATDTATVTVDVRGSASKNIQIYAGATFNGSMVA
jgi:hypothetical protein